MKIIEAYVTKKNLTDIFKIIEKKLSENPNTQVFIDNEIYEKLHGLSGAEYHVFSPNMPKTWHYNVDNDNFGGEEWLVLTTGNTDDNAIFSASFIKNCKGYYQLVEFKSYNSKNYPRDNYTHYLTGFENLLLIHLKK